MEDRAKELAMAVNTILRDGNEFISIDRDTAKEIADLLAPPEYPCNGELVEYKTLGGAVRSGYAGDGGICYRVGGPMSLPWTEIKDYRIIREAREFVPTFEMWPDGAKSFAILPRYHGADDRPIDLGFPTHITRAEAEEMHRELK